jgi:transposase
MDQQLIRQCVGIDISKESFTACVCSYYRSGEEQLTEVVEFKNQKTGFNQLVKWSRKITSASVPVGFVMEATGVYYEALAYHLHRLNQPVSVLLPNKVKYFAKSWNVKTKTDIVDARIIARMGAERKLSLWEPPLPIFKQLRDLTRAYSELMKEKTAFSNRLHALNSSYEPLALIVKSNKSIIKKLDEQLVRFKAEIEKVIYSESWLAEKVKKVLTIKGVGLTTVAVILAETQGFEFVDNIRQLCSYAGYDVVQRESGTSVQGKTRISKKGNSWIRAALHFPALVASRHNENLKNTYLRINEKKPSKMIGATALQRKILVLIYTLWKNDTVYDEAFEKKRKADRSEVNKKTLRQNKTKAGRSINNLPAQDELKAKDPLFSLV